MFFFGENRLMRDRRPAADADSGPDAAEECRLES
jgi:hypothetical protein